MATPEKAKSPYQGYYERGTAKFEAYNTPDATPNQHLIGGSFNQVKSHIVDPKIGGISLEATPSWMLNIVDNLRDRWAQYNLLRSKPTSLPKVHD